MENLKNFWEMTSNPLFLLLWIHLGKLPLWQSLPCNGHDPSGPRNTPLFRINYCNISFKLGKNSSTLVHGNFVKNREILSNWEGNYFFVSGSTDSISSRFFTCELFARSEFFFCLYPISSRWFQLRDQIKTNEKFASREKSRKWKTGLTDEFWVIGSTISI
jgi:hypothetical protein